MPSSMTSKDPSPTSPMSSAIERSRRGPTRPMTPPCVRPLASSSMSSGSTCSISTPRSRASARRRPRRRSPGRTAHMRWMGRIPASSVASAETCPSTSIGHWLTGTEPRSGPYGTRSASARKRASTLKRGSPIASRRTSSEPMSSTGTGNSISPSGASIAIVPYACRRPATAAVRSTSVPR